MTMNPVAKARKDFAADHFEYPEGERERAAYGEAYANLVRAREARASIRTDADVFERAADLIAERGYRFEGAMDTDDLQEALRTLAQAARDEEIA